MTRPLQNLVVLDLTHVLAGPFASLTLGDLGAKVIKVERPGTGDDTRTFPPFKDGASAYFAAINHGKQSIALDLKAGRTAPSSSNCSRAPTSCWRITTPA